MDILIRHLLDGDQAQAIVDVKKLRTDGCPPRRIITEAVEAAMERLDVKCTVEQFNLLEIMLCGRAVMGVMNELYPPDQPPPQTKATIVTGALEGDVHDLGKNILKIVLTASGYRVIDCGKDCPNQKIIDAAVQESALAVGISGLITTVIPGLRRLRDKMIDQGLGHVKLMAGGAALKQASAESLNVDYVAQTSFDGLHYLEQLTGEKR
jgi:methanogenic corrinoid protein MtbC1